MLMYYGNALRAAGVPGPALRRGRRRSSLGKRSGNRSNTDSVTDSDVAVSGTGEVTHERHHGHGGTPKSQPGPPPGRGTAVRGAVHGAKSQNDFCTERPRALISIRGGV